VTPVRKAPKVNYCSLFGKNAGIVEYKHVFTELIESNNSPAPCPIKPGTYHIENYSMLTKKLPTFEKLARNNTKMYIQITLEDENGKKIVQILSYKVFLVYRKD
jgi:Protein of unknown function (DUF1091)